MAALTATTPTRLGVVTSGSAVAATDTIAAALLGNVGAILEIINGNASPDAMTISDSGSSPAGTPVGTYAGSVTNATSKAFFIDRRQVDPTTNLVTITHSVTATVTYKLYPVG